MGNLKPTGYVAVCQCGRVVGALDLQHTEKKEAGKILGIWIGAGCTLEPRFTETWAVTVQPCRCEKEARQ